jgi:hypothetical protein
MIWGQKNMKKLADFDHKLVKQTASRLAFDTKSPREVLERIFLFVRDDIQFAFPPEGDFVKASQTIERGYGQCNTKGILFLALCKACDIPARIHFSQITKEIQRGFFTGIAYWLMPNKLTHSWIEVKIDDQWHSIDTYINDIQLHNAALEEITRRGWTTGFSVSRANGEPSACLHLDDAHFSQMAAVSGDDGVWDDPVEFFNGPNYLNTVGPIRRWLYKLYLPLVNARVSRLRELGSSSI